MEIISAIVDFMVTKQESPAIRKKLPTDLNLYDFIIFYKENELKFAKMFGVFKVVPTEKFIIDDFGFTVGTIPGVVYQVRAKADGSLFLQGKKSVFVYKCNDYYIYKYQKWLQKKNRKRKLQH